MIRRDDYDGMIHLINIFDPSCQIYNEKSTTFIKFKVYDIEYAVVINQNISTLYQITPLKDPSYRIFDIYFDNIELVMSSTSDRTKYTLNFIDGTAEYSLSRLSKYYD